MTPEGKLKKEARDYIDSQKGTWRYSPVSTGYGKHGVPDDIVCFGGLFFSVEYKSKGKHPTALQCVQLTDIYNAGGIAGCVWSIEDVKNLFQDGRGILPVLGEPGKYFTVQYQV